jgi:hypothetical protein
MGEMVSFHAGREAVRELTTPAPGLVHEKAMRAYLRGEAYTASRTTEQPQPVDEPAPPVDRPRRQRRRRSPAR